MQSPLIILRAEAVQRYSILASIRFYKLNFILLYPTIRTKEGVLLFLVHFLSFHFEEIRSHKLNRVINLRIGLLTMVQSAKETDAPLYIWQFSEGLRGKDIPEYQTAFVTH